MVVTERLDHLSHRHALLIPHHRQNDILVPQVIWRPPAQQEPSPNLLHRWVNGVLVHLRDVLQFRSGFVVFTMIEDGGGEGSTEVPGDVNLFRAGMSEEKRVEVGLGDGRGGDGVDYVWCGSRRWFEKVGGDGGLRRRIDWLGWSHREQLVGSDGVMWMKDSRTKTVLTEQRYRASVWSFSQGGAASWRQFKACPSDDEIPLLQVAARGCRSCPRINCYPKLIPSS